MMINPYNCVIPFPPSSYSCRQLPLLSCPLHNYAGITAYGNPSPVGTPLPREGLGVGLLGVGFRGGPSLQQALSEDSVLDVLLVVEHEAGNNGTEQRR